jgi:lipopolysaccharide transport system ATP-binding protein
MSSETTRRRDGAGGAGLPVLSVQDVSKCYHIYDKPRDRLKQAVRRGVGRGDRQYYREFWALKDVSFDLFPGEAIGVVGRNGSGKSTLLQIIAGTLSPTHGQITVRGRISALLELGSGFNPEFTGRENVLLYGAILGIPRREMLRRFDEIADFAEIGQFIEQPVKTYSSGMHARLAFSVAVSVNPDILILDEILAVGDIAFQQKCVSKMFKLVETGVTLLFVSHAPDAVKSICKKGLFLRDGRLAHLGSAEEAVDRYFNYVRDQVNEHAQHHQPVAVLKTEVEERTEVDGAARYGTGHMQVEAVRLLDDRGRIAEAFTYGEHITVDVVVKALVELDKLDVHMAVRDSVGVDLFGTGTADERVHFPPLAPGSRTSVRFRFLNTLRGGSYGVSVTLSRLPENLDVGGVTLDHVTGVAGFTCIPDPLRMVHYKVYNPTEVTWSAVEDPAVVVSTPQPAETR